MICILSLFLLFLRKGSETLTLKNYRMKKACKTPFFVVITLLIYLVSFPSTLSAQRELKTINDGWRFIKQDIPQASDAEFNDKQWEHVSIPHTWNSDAYVDKQYYRGVGWYRKNLYISDEYKDKQVFIRFEAANTVASVYVNDSFVGEHKGGYTSFTFDITPYCLIGKDNQIAVKVDNSLTDVPPVSGDFTIFGGIYRDVWLITTPKQHFDLSDFGSNGVYIDTKDVSQSAASYIIRGNVKNDGSLSKKIEVTYTLKDPQGKIIKTDKNTITIQPNSKSSFSYTGKIDNPQLWSPEHPNLYAVETSVYDPKIKQVLDKVNNNTGFRWYKFDGKEGFFLNGKPYKLNGVCRHQDQQPIGNALSDEMHRRDMQMIKDMGVNFIRISHYPQDDAILEQCDKLGLLAWEEIPVIDIVPEDKNFTGNCENMLREMIRQHYNHTSVIMWGYMNEILLMTQRKYQGDALKAPTDRALTLANHLEKVLKEEDLYRPSTMAFHGSDSYNKAGFNDIVDVVGWNLYQGWYSDDFTGFERFLRDQQAKHPDNPKIVSEYGAGSDKRIHSLNPQRFDFSIEYQQEYIEHYLPVIEKEKYISGATYWNFIDFGSAARDESMPRINNKGLVYSDRIPKDVYFLFKSFYRKDIPVIHIASHDWQSRTGITRTGEPCMQPVKVYSNMDEVELFQNGKSLGIKKCDNRTATWSVPFTDGEHFFTAKGVFEGKSIETGLTISFNSIPEVLNNQNLENLELAINAGSTSFFTSSESNLTWVPDKEYTSGSCGFIGGKTYDTVGQIMGTADNPLYQSLRESPDQYRFDVPAGRYEVELSFSDIFLPKEKVAYDLSENSQQEGSNENVFNIVINGKVVESKVNPARNVGFYGVDKKRFIVEVSERNCIEIKLVSLSGKSFINALKVRKL